MNNELLIVFQKNLVSGRVKTRLAESLGDFKALEIYRSLVISTRNAVKGARFRVALYYSDFIDEDDIWKGIQCSRYVQATGDLGIRMRQAFLDGFGMGYEKVCIIGTDCPDISTDLLESAFDALSGHDYVIGPARDGGYYLLGMKQFFGPIFENKNWSTSTVFSCTVSDLIKAGKSGFKLEELTDIDTEEDLRHYEKHKLHMK